MKNELYTQTFCYHCGDVCATKNVAIGKKYFCCSGCKTVFELLNNNNLCTYYDLNETPGIAHQVRIRKNKFSFLDNLEIKKKLIHYSDGRKTQVTFYLPQIHCSSCLWLLENIYRLNEGILSSRVNFSKKEIFVVFDENATTLRGVVETLAQIGYEPHLNLQSLSPKITEHTNKSRLQKIGIAGFCFANIMMMSLPEYFSMGKGIEPLIGTFLRSLIVLLSLPVLFYCASEFFISAWNGLKNSYLNIDAPIALALIITFGRSIYEIYTQTGSGYLDSMSGIVFFMLIGRWLQERTYQRIAFDRDYKSFFPIAVNVIRNKKIIPIPVEQVKESEIIQIQSEEIIPVDAILSKGEAVIDYSFVSGEAMPVKVQKGELIYAGGKQLGGLIELLVVKEVSQSYLTNLWNNDVFRRKAPPKATIFDAIGKYFTYIVLAIGASAGMYWWIQGQSLLMWNALTTVLIVACPCTLLLAANYTNGHILRIFGLNQFYLRSPEVIEKLGNIDHIVFDKTGTLTQSRQAKVNYKGTILSKEQITLIASVLTQTMHPLSRAVLEHLATNELIDVTNFKETKGEGIEAWVNERYLKIGSWRFVDTDKSKTSNSLFVKIDGTLLGAFTVANIYRFGIFDLVKTLKNKFSISVLSGDNDAELPTIQQIIGTGSDILFDQKPDEKLAYIAHLQTNKHAKVMMVGDGLNDAGALKMSDVGIAVADSNNTFSPASDAIIAADRLAQLDTFLAFVKAGKSIILFSFALSFIYNAIGLGFAVQGTLSPLVAAILMPCSAVSVVLLTYGLTELAARQYKINK